MKSYEASGQPLPARLVAGLVAGAASVTVVLLAKVLFRVPTLPELAQDRMLQHVPGEVFAFMLEHLLYLGKPALFVSLLGLQVLVVGVLSLVATRWPRVLVLAGVLWLVTGLLLLPLVGRGVFDHRLDVALLTLLSYAAFAAVLIGLQLTYREEKGTAPERSARVVVAGISRREVVSGAFFLLAAAVLTKVAIGELPKRPGINPDGLPDPITSNDNFYIVSKNLFDPEIEAGGWRLRIDGLVDTPLNLSYADIQAMPSEDFVRTLECISNDVGGDLISTGRFTGVRMSEVLKRAGVRSQAQMLHFTSEDGYTENMSVQKAMLPETFLVYRLNGEPLPQKHGYPLRVLGAGTYGMKNPKWLTRIELAVSPPEGFWEHQGWNPDAIVQTMSRVDSPRRAVAAGSVTIGGIAFAGDRGIQGVEVSLDGGKAWQTASLLPRLGPLTWVFWQYTADLGGGEYHVVVRAVDGSGTPQVAEDSSTYPSGATGYHHLQIEVADKGKA